MAYKIPNGNEKQNPKSNTTHQNVKKELHLRTYLVF